ncbi:hypothetical protein Jab_2c26760 [Janthinobacterium sp. HH01]|nr:hypothetical protein Jab_2c26760 [Janthinobacterium sp. HH01]
MRPWNHRQRTAKIRCHVPLHEIERNGIPEYLPAHLLDAVGRIIGFTSLHFLRHGQYVTWLDCRNRPFAQERKDIVFQPSAHLVLRAGRAHLPLHLQPLERDGFKGMAGGDQFHLALLAPGFRRIDAVGQQHARVVAPLARLDEGNLGIGAQCHRLALVKISVVQPPVFTLRFDINVESAAVVMLVPARLACLGETKKGVSECHGSLPLSVYEIELSSDIPTNLTVSAFDFMSTLRIFKDNKKPASPMRRAGFSTS